ncbi:MAG: prolyl oligopeptidase family serine peptidase [Fimbriimonadaceae bacterium]|nr:prolyl oligopeptidase family serine peptidase [Fimbriimonadaceae bacterium]
MAVVMGIGTIVAQCQSLTAPPPPIQFGPMRLRESQEFYREYQVEFPSARPSGVAANDTVTVRAWFPTTNDGPVPFVLMLHYWGATDLGLESALAKRLANAGIASAAIALPYHLERTPQGKRSGEAALTADSGELKLTMAQALADVRRTLDWAQGRPEVDASRMGIVGTSLGALVAALSFGVDHRIEAGAFLLGGADLAHVFWNSSRTVALRNEMRSQGYTEERLRSELTEIEPMEALKGAPPRPALVLSARYDNVVPPRSSSTLVAALAEPQVIILDSGHYGGSLIQNAILRNTAEFFAKTFRGEQYRAPGRLYVPTLRVGLALTSERGLQVAVGLDLWRLRNSNSLFASALATPQGVQGFLGYNLSSGLAVGAMVLPKHIQPGLFWSIVF